MRREEKQMGRHIEVIGIDHGWSNMKTAEQVFTTGVKKISTEPAFYDDVVEWRGAYYKVGGKRLEVQDTKVENDNFYLLTLAGIAKEMKKRGLREGCILMAVGLPLTRFGAEKQDFIRYLARDRRVVFRFEKEKYQICIARVSVFPQCYAAVAESIRKLPERAVVVDIGSWTIDIMPLNRYYPNEPECITIPQGLIRCMRQINEECVRRVGQELDESILQEIMAGGKGKLPGQYGEIVEGCLKNFAEKVFLMLREHGHNLDVTPVIFAGGGAAVMKRFGSREGAYIQYIEDVRANARGYEYLGRIYLASNRRALEAGAV